MSGENDGRCAVEPSKQGAAVADHPVFFVGAGPGDPDLLTLKAQRLIGQADVIVYAGSLVNPAVLANARQDAQVYDSAHMKLADQMDLMIGAATAGQRVVRLHTGDPSVYGAIAEQMRELDKAGVSYAVVPGVSSAFAAAAALGIEFTLPESTQTLILTRLGGCTPVPDRERLRDLAAHRSSLVIFLSAGVVDAVVDELKQAGYPDDTPVAVVFRASWPDELILRGTLATIAGQTQMAEVTHHAVIVVSPALDLRTGVTSKDSHLYGGAQREPELRDTTAIIALTRRGTQNGRRLMNLVPQSVLYAPARFLDGDDALNDDLRPFTASVRSVLHSAFNQHSALICLMATGIVVRELCPLLRGKHVDPPVVVLDEDAQHAVSLLGGHKGGANALARQVADLLGCVPVLTTASDVRGLPAIDLLGSDEGWAVKRMERLPAVSGALINGDHVGVFQDSGSETWWPAQPPANLVKYPSLAALEAAAPRAALVVTRRRVSLSLMAAIPDTVYYHPPCLAVGIGCNRGTSTEDILAAVETTFLRSGLAMESVCCLATVEDKADEMGMLQLCRQRNWPLRVFSRGQIASAPAPANPSPWALKTLGIPGVAEPAALLAANTNTLLVEKQVFPDVTVAVACMAHGGGIQ